MTIIQGQPELVGANTNAATSFEAEKNTVIQIGTEPVSNGSEKDSSDANSENFQLGVQRVRGVTAVWSKQTLWIMFAL